MKHTTLDDLGRSPYDSIIFGAGSSGFAAAVTLRRMGRRVLLIDRHATPVKECAWSFALDTGESGEPLWREWLGRLDSHGAVRGGHIDGAIAEILASKWLQDEGIDVLYHAVPVEVIPGDGGAVRSVVMGTKSGMLRLSAHEWVDATDCGELACLLQPGWQVPSPVRQTVTITFRLGRKACLPDCEIPLPMDAPFLHRLSWKAGLWPGEQLLKIELPGDFEHPSRAWVPALKALRTVIPEVDLQGALVTHGSVIPYKAFALRTSGVRLAENVVFIGARGMTLAEKFTVKALLGALGPSLGWAEAAGCRRFQSDVVVAGLGTGGALAAIAAGRVAPGARILALEAMPFPGGIGTGGGFHVYYFGTPGGLQEEVNRRVRDLMPLFGSASQVGGFHPEAKKLALDAMMAELGVACFYDAMLVSVETREGLVESVLISTPRGLMRVQARGWVDATGDGDLAAMAGGNYRLGRAGDGLLHAYSQSSGRVRVGDGVARMEIPNYDAGYCDPTDVWDLSRARLAGVAHYWRERYTEDDRPTCIAPLIGLRQSRQFITEYELTLDDLINRRRFPDVVGYTGGHYDNHARDYEFESVEAAFWVWVCQQWHGRLACEIPWRMLLPKGLKNVVLGCRAMGVSEEAHHSFRMQRDVQRIGEVAGVGCVLAARAGGSFHDMLHAQLRACLMQTGAVKLEEPSELAGAFGGNIASPEFYDGQEGCLARWLEEINGGPATEAIWHLYRSFHNSETRNAVEGLLISADSTSSWRAAAIMSMWGDARAEPRLWQAIHSREDDKVRDITRPQQEWFYVPRWYAALTILKRCITPASLPLLKELSLDSSLVLNLRSAVALACEALARRTKLSDADKNNVESVLSALLRTRAPHAHRDPGQPTLILSERERVDGAKVSEDYEWQLHLAVARARRAIGLVAHEAAVFLARHDCRAIIRKTLSLV